MKQVKSSLQHGIRIFNDSHRVYKKLQKHLNAQPVGFPATVTGVERRLLRAHFTVDDAEVALYMSYKFQTAGDLLNKVSHLGITEEDLQKRLDSMEKNGSIFAHMRDGEKKYALCPFAIGMFDQKVSVMDADYWIDLRKYNYLGYAAEYLTTSEPQIRTIPIQSSVPKDMQISAYDEVRQHITMNDGHICLAPCVCRVGMDTLGRHCKATDRRDVCLVIGDFGDQYIRNGFGRAISAEEALDVLAKNEKDGLILETSNSQKALFVCSCCTCCCGSLEQLSFLAKPSEFIRSNFYTVLDGEKCKACGTCAETCAMDAVVTKKAKAVRIDTNRCLGCGLCVTRCPSGALSLAKKTNEYTPPETFEALLGEIKKDKKGAVRRQVQAARKMIGL